MEKQVSGSKLFFIWNSRFILPQAIIEENVLRGRVFQSIHELSRVSTCLTHRPQEIPFISVFVNVRVGEPPAFSCLALASLSIKTHAKPAFTEFPPEPVRKNGHRKQAVEES